ncbi:hypothetical protein [Paenibacillus xylanilyticus]|uniref:hypothetical protein n=1 Tax=Paenibacillus xylanilyticus TaxID=248903 RepID=UPI0039A0C3B7
MKATVDGEKEYETLTDKIVGYTKDPEKADANQWSGYWCRGTRKLYHCRKEQEHCVISD